MKLFSILGFIFFLTPVLHYAQDDRPDIEKYLSRAERGDADRMRQELPSLLASYPNNPGVLYLQGVLTVDGTEAVRIYQSIVDNFPHSEWADDALYKVYQFYYAIGLYRTAEIKLTQLKGDYPQSKYIAEIVHTDTKTLAEERQSPGSAKTEDDTLQQGPAGQAIVETPPVQQPESTVSRPEPTQQALYTLQVGAYSQQVNAEKQKLFFEDLGYTVEMINKVRDARSLFVVLVGEYKTADDARGKGVEFKKKYNINSMVVTR